MRKECEAVLKLTHPDSVEMYPCLFLHQQPGNVPPVLSFITSKWKYLLSVGWRMIKLFVVTVRLFVRIQSFLRKCLSRFVGSLRRWQLPYTVRVCFHKINTKNSDMDICFILLCAKLCTTEPLSLSPEYRLFFCASTGREYDVYIGTPETPMLGEVTTK